ncbi:MAG TPA: NADH-quinone oxidoreductase subunit C [Vicinamibacterales bacterium]|nr:NADH-quinone oxidoreductase subunit C [Vicinamibacterales bacterium]
MSDDPKNTQPPTPPAAGADKPASAGPAEPLKGEVSRTDAPGAGASAAPVGPPRTEPPAPKPANPEAAVTAATSETSSATGKPTAAAASPTKPVGAEAAKPAPAAKAPHVPPPPAPPSGPPDPAPPADKAVPGFIATLQSTIADGVARASFYLGDWTVIVPVARLLDVARHLRDAPDARFDYLSDLTATDWPPRKEGRFDVVYMLYSTRHRHRVRLKVIVAEDQGIASVTSIWPAANWLEREVYDMFGVNFTGHPDRRRILMPEDWQGFPQRKDYPLEGPGELLMENPIDWLKLKQAREEADIE